MKDNRIISIQLYRLVMGNSYLKTLIFKQVNTIGTITKSLTITYQQAKDEIAKVFRMKLYHLITDIWLTDFEAIGKPNYEINEWTFLPLMQPQSAHLFTPRHLDIYLTYMYRAKDHKINVHSFYKKILTSVNFTKDVRVFKRSYQQIITYCPTFSDTDIHELVASHGSIELMQAAFETKPEIKKIPSIYGAACESTNSFAMVKYLHEKLGKDPIVEKISFSRLALSGQVDTFKYLVPYYNKEKAYSVDHKITDWTLDCACKSRNLELVKFLVENKSKYGIKNGISNLEVMVNNRKIYTNIDIPSLELIKYIQDQIPDNYSGLYHIYDRIFTTLTANSLHAPEYITDQYKDFLDYISSLNIIPSADLYRTRQNTNEKYPNNIPNYGSPVYGLTMDYRKLNELTGNGFATFPKYQFTDPSLFTKLEE